MRKINDLGLALLKRFEGCRLTSYLDAVGIPTIGYGHTGTEVTPNWTITQAEADAMLEKDLEKFYHLDEYLSEQVNDNQYSALVCLCYNIGLRALKLSTVIKRINAGIDPDIEWMQWVHGTLKDGTKITLKGLVARRKAELELYNTLE